MDGFHGRSDSCQGRLTQYLILLFSLSKIVTVAVLVRCKLEKKICVHSGSQIFMIVTMFCFIIDLQMQRTHTPHLLYTILKFSVVL